MTPLDSSDSYVQFYLNQLKNGDFESAFHSLTEVGYCVVPKLIDAFRAEVSAPVRAELVRIIWNHRRPESAEFLGEALHDPKPEVWKAAIDGLVTLGTPSALEHLESALRREYQNKKASEVFRTWVTEAIEQVRAG